MNNGHIAYIGTYTKKTSMGIYALRYGAETGALGAPMHVGRSVNPSFLVQHPNRRYLYAVNEARVFDRKPGGGVSAFAVEADTGRLTEINRVSSGGADPCHVCLDRTGRWLFAANYTGGSIAVFPLAEDGSVGAATQVLLQVGDVSGVNPIRQEAPHAHSVDMSDDNRFLYMNDLGLDQILIYDFDSVHGKLTERSTTKTAPGSGPRHLVFSPDRCYMYVMNELLGSVTAYHHDPADASIEPFQMVSSMPFAWDGLLWGAEIAMHPSGEFLFVSNRAHDSIATFHVARSDGRITLMGHVPTGGIQPRHFTLDPEGNFLHVANADSNSLVSFAIDLSSGKLTPTGQVIELPEPVCILFAPLA